MIARGIFKAGLNKAVLQTVTTTTTTTEEQQTTVIVAPPMVVPITITKTITVKTTKEMTRAEFALLVNTSSTSQMFSLFKQAKNNPKLAKLTVGQVLTNTQYVEGLIDKAFERVRKNL